MEERPSFSIDTSKLRPGQRQAIDTITDRVRQGRTHTAIVLPTRYGKTDVMRVSALSLWRDGLVSRALVLEPNLLLVKQAVNTEKWKQSLTRYGIRLPMPLSTYGVDRAPLPPFPPSDAIFTAISTQMVNLHKGFFVHWVDHERAREPYVPPIIYIDEAHTGSEANQWGDTVEVLAAAGAYVVLLTATPYRADSQRIPGFEVVAEAVDPVKVGRRRTVDGGEIVVDIFEGLRHRYKLVAHHVTTFRQAWDEETPSPLCKVTRRTFEIDLTKLLGGEETDTKLAALSERDSQRILMPALKDPLIIRQACQILADELCQRKQDAPDTAAIVFVGNDEQSDREVNRHAKDVQAALRALAPALKTVIVTASEGDKAPANIAAFQGGDGDVLIVKQMASIGLDIPRLKVALDLSNVRTPAAFVQRMTRICTIWERGTSPHEHVRTAVFICPDDIRGRALYQRFIIDEGGEAVVTDLKLVETVLPKEGPKPDEPMYLPQAVSLPERYGDTDQKEARGDTLPKVAEFLGLFPELSRTRTHPTIADALERHNIRFDMSPPKVRNVNEEEEARITRVHALAQKLTMRAVTAILGKPYASGDPSARALWAQKSKEVWNRHKRMVGVDLGMELRDIHDIGILDQMHLNMWKDFNDSLGYRPG